MYDLSRDLSFEDPGDILVTNKDIVCSIHAWTLPSNNLKVGMIGRCENVSKKLRFTYVVWLQDMSIDCESIAKHNRRQAPTTRFIEKSISCIGLYNLPI